MNRRGFVLALFGAAAGLALAHRESMALPMARPQPPEPELSPEAGLLSEEERAQLSLEEARLRRHRHVVVRRYYVRPRRRHWNRGRHLGWYRRRPRRRVYYYY
jgi:Ni/Co efflux regulator RcnB